MKDQLYFLSFIEEAIQNPKFYDYVGGRVEVYKNRDEYADEEIRFLTKERGKFWDFRETWDFQEVDEDLLNKIRERLEIEFQDYSEIDEISKS